MATVTYNGASYACDKALKGTDFIHLLDANGNLTHAFDGVADFTKFTISGGSWTTPAEADDCYLATIGEDGRMQKSSHKSSEIGDKAPAYTYGTTDLTAGTSELATGRLYFVYE